MPNIGKIAAYYSSPGGMGDYAEASTVLAARTVFPGTGAPVFTVLCFAKDAEGEFMLAGAGGPAFGFNANTGLDAVLINNTPTVYVSSALADPSGSAWVHCAAVCDSGSFTAYGNGLSASGSLSFVGQFSAADSLAALLDQISGKISNIHIFDRALSAAEIVAISAAGVEHDIRTASEGWVGEVPVVSWCDSAINGRVANSGYGGECDLILHGAVASVPFALTYAEYPLPYPAKILEALTYAMGKEAQYIAGTPVTHMLSNYTAGDPYIYVKSTLGFQHAGIVRVAGRQFTYTSKTPRTFDGLSGDWIYYNIPKSSKVVAVTGVTKPSQIVAGIDHLYNVVERDYLPFDGVADYGYADRGARDYLAGTKGNSQYALVLKLATYGETANAYTGNLGSLVDNGIVAGTYLCAGMVVTGVDPGIDQVYGGGNTAAGATAWTSAGIDITNEAQVLSVAHDRTDNLGYYRHVLEDGTNAGTYGSGVIADRNPDTVTVGASVDGDNVVQGGYAEMGLVAAVFLSKVPTNAELQAYANPYCRDARTVWSQDDLKGYWPASYFSTTESSIRNLAGAVPMIVVGPLVTELVPWPTP